MKLTDFTRLVLLVGCVYMASCSEKNDDSPEHIQNIIENFDPTPMNFTEEAGEQSFSFTANAAWTATVATTRSGNEPWCTINPTRGEAGTHIIYVTTKPNESYDNRSVTITLKAGNESKSFAVTQKQQNALLLTNNKFEIDQKGGVITVEVKANINYTATIDETCKDWISENEANRALSVTTKNYVISANNNNETREGTIVFSDGTLTETVHVYQIGGPIVLLSQKEHYVSASGEDIVVELRSNCDYEVIMPSVDWITENAARSMSSHTLYYTIAPNETYDNREAQIVYRDKKDSNVADTLTIQQAQKDAIILSNKNIKIDSGGGTIEVTIDANINFETQLPEENWIEEVSSRTLVTHKKYFKIAENINQTAREAQVLFRNTASGIEEVLTVTQSAKKKRVRVKVEKPGTLPDVILETDRLDIEELEISGSLGGLDIALIREMAGRSRNNNHQTEGKLKYLDMTEANIVADGEYYLQFSDSDETFYPADNAISERMFNGCFLQTVLLPKSIKAIENNAFFLCTNLAKIVIFPNSVTTIGEDAFNGCKQLTDIRLSEGIETIKVRAFSHCNSLSEVIIPTSMISIEGFAFFDCPIRSIIIPDNVKSMGSLTFNSDGLHITIPEHLLGKYIFPASSDCKDLHVTIAEGATTIKERTFGNYSGLVRIDIPESVTSIEKEAFYNCSGLTEIIIPKNVVVIGETAFAGCNGLTHIIIPNNVTSIGEGAFRGCSELNEVVLPNSLSSIGSYVFKGCSKLTKINIPKGLKMISDFMFSYCSSLKNIIIPDWVTSIGIAAFEACDSRTIVIPESVTSTGWGVFRENTNLSITLPGNLLDYKLFTDCTGLKITVTDGSTYINQFALSQCTELKEINIPNSVSSIGSHAFDGCSSLKSIVIPDKVISIEEATFYYCI